MMYDDLLARHGTHLTRAQASAVAEHLRRYEARKEFALPSARTRLEQQSAFITFERVFGARPARLFGQNVPSAAHTMVRIMRSKLATDGVEIEPAEEIFSARVSEKGLTEAVMYTNTGDVGCPLTARSFAGDLLPPLEKDSHLGEKARASNDQNRAEKAQRLERFEEVLMATPAKPTKDLKDVCSGLAYAVRDVTDVAFAVGQYHEAMAEVGNQLVVEAAHMALHASKVSSALQSTTALLPAPDTTSLQELARTNPIVDALMDEMGDELREGLRILLIKEVERLAVRLPKLTQRIGTDDGRPVLVLAAGQDMTAVAQGASEEERQRLEEIVYAWNHAFNPHVHQRRAYLDPRTLALSLSRREGYPGRSFALHRDPYHRNGSHDGFAGSSGRPARSLQPAHACLLRHAPG